MGLSQDLTDSLRREEGLLIASLEFLLKSDNISPEQRRNIVELLERGYKFGLEVQGAKRLSEYSHLTILERLRQLDYPGKT